MGWLWSFWVCFAPCNIGYRGYNIDEFGFGKMCYYPWGMLFKCPFLQSPSCLFCQISMDYGEYICSVNCRWLNLLAFQTPLTLDHFNYISLLELHNQPMQKDGKQILGCVTFDFKCSWDVIMLIVHWLSVLPSSCHELVVSLFLYHHKLLLSHYQPLHCQVPQQLQSSSGSDV